MSSQADVKAKRLTASGSAFAERTRVKGYHVTGGVGTVQFRDGGSSGNVVLEVDLPVANTIFALMVPGEGILCYTNLYLSFTGSVSACTVFYG